MEKLPTCVHVTQLLCVSYHWHVKVHYVYIVISSNSELYTSEKVMNQPAILVH